MKFRRFKINKDSSRVVLHKLSNVVIKKNPNVQKEHIITKIKKHERLYIGLLACIFIVIFMGIGLIVGTSYKHFMAINSFDVGDLTVEYSPTLNGIGDIVTLYDSSIMPDSKAKEEEGNKFLITNNSSKKMYYNIILDLDEEFINLDNCREKMFLDSEIKFNINGGKPIFLESRNDSGRYLLMEDWIPANSSKYYSLNMWIDNNTKMEDKHFHGIIDVDVKKRA